MHKTEGNKMRQDFLILFYRVHIQDYIPREILILSYLMHQEPEDEDHLSLPQGRQRRRGRQIPPRPHSLAPGAWYDPPP